MPGILRALAALLLIVGWVLMCLAGLWEDRTARDVENPW